MTDAVRFLVAPITHVDVRDVSDAHGYWTMSGYAAVFNQKTTLYDGRFLKLTEEISPNFFDRVLRDQQLDQPDGVVHFNLGHDMNRAVAATDVPAGQPGSLQLRSDATGLGFLAKVPADDPDGLAMAVKMRSGVLRQASFAFTIAKQDSVYRERGEDDEGEKDEEHITLMECKHLYDVCATPQGAYAQTVAGLRSLAALLGQPDFSGDRTPASPEDRETGAPSAAQESEPVPVTTPEWEASRSKLGQSVDLKRELARSRFVSRRI